MTQNGYVKYYCFYNEYCTILLKDACIMLKMRILVRNFQTFHKMVLNTKF